MRKFLMFVAGLSAGAVAGALLSQRPGADLAKEMASEGKEGHNPLRPFFRDMWAGKLRLWSAAEGQAREVAATGKAAVKPLRKAAENIAAEGAESLQRVAADAKRTANTAASEAGRMKATVKKEAGKAAKAARKSVQS